MFKRFLNLEWKSFFRSASLGKSLALKIVMIFFGIYMLVSLAASGAFLFVILQKLFPDIDPVLKVSEFMIYWLLFELVLRYFMQKLPVMNVKPLLMLPIKKGTITHYMLGSSVFSVYNFLSLFLFIPFCIVLLVNDYPSLNVLVWLLSITGLVLTANYVNFLINKSDKILVIFGLFIVGLYTIEYFEIFPLTEYAGKLFYTLYQYPLLVFIPLSLMIGSYYINYYFLRNRIFLDQSLKKKTKAIETSDLDWTKKFGDIAPFLQLDLKLIWRNKRTKTQVFLSIAMIFYGLVFYTMDDFGVTSPMMVFIGLFITGIFLSNFGQFIPAWDSAYYSMIMSQNIPLRKYLESKAGLISVSVVFMFLLSIPYVYFGWEALAINFSCALYNLGINIPLILLAGSMNKKRIDLDKSAFANMQGTGAIQFLIVLPLFGVPMILFSLLYYLISFEVAVLILSVIGIIGFAFKKPLLDWITEIYRSKKYGMIAGFKEKNS
jgi:hypothetical protein